MQSANATLGRPKHGVSRMAKAPQSRFPDLSTVDPNDLTATLLQISDQFQAAYDAIPEVVVAAGKDRVAEFLQGHASVANLFNVTPERLRQLVEHGYTQFKTGRYDDAAKIFHVLTFLEWNNPYYHSMRGSILQRQKKDGEAVAEFSQAIKLSPVDVVSWVGRAEVFLRHGHLDYAQHDLNEALKLKDADPKVLAHAKLLKERIAQAFAKHKKEAKVKKGT